MPAPDSYDLWLEQFTEERSRLLAALRTITEGGIIEDLQHVGATSVPGLPPSPCMDIALSVWPFPLEAPSQAAIEALGYERICEAEVAHEQRFRHSTDKFRLYLVEAGSDAWMNFLLVRDYLRNDEGARRTYSAHKRDMAATTTSESVNHLAAKTHLFLELLAPASAWWTNYHGFAPIEAVAHELKEFAHPWYFSSGWALDLFLGQVTRVHLDVDVVVSRADQLALQQYMTIRGWKFFAPWQGRLEPWPAHMQLELPRHQAHALRDGRFIDFLISDVANGMWVYRRNPVVVRTMDRASLCTSEGMPFLAPELVLLFKSKNTSGKERGKDQSDFERTYPRLEPERRAWLRWALMATDPTHPWLERLV